MNRSRLATVVAAVLAAVVAAAATALILRNDEDEGEEASVTTTTTTTTTTAFEDTTTTTTGTTTTSSTTTTAPTTTTALRATTTTTARAGATTTAARGRCGSGHATATFVARDLETTSQGSSFTPTATVENRVDRPIEVEALVYDVVYPDATRRVTFVTSGRVIAPGTSVTFTADRLSTPTQYETTRLVRFAYFTEGRRDCLVST